MRRKRSKWVVCILIAGVAALLLALGAPVAGAATQTYDGDVIRMVVSDDTRPGIYVKPSTAAGSGDPYIQQYYAGSAWGSVVWLDDGVAWSGYCGSYHFAGSGFTPVSNVTNAVPGGTEIVTVVALGTTGVQLTQRFTHLTGDRFVTKEWVLTNNGSTTFSNVRLYHGGDTYFGNNDLAYGFYDPSKSMVYVRNLDYANWGIMGFYANPATPADRYFQGNYYTCWQHLCNRADLPNTVDANYQDAGYALEWDRSALAPGQSWTIQAYEVWTPGGPLQLLAPGTQNVASESTVTLPFTVQNLSEEPLNLTLSAAADTGWAASIVGSTTVTVPANSSVVQNVQVIVPAAATGNAAVTLTAAGDAAGTATATLTVVENVDVAITPASVNFGTLAPGASGSQVVTITNNGTDPVTFGTVSASGQFGIADDTCSGVTLAAGASCTVTATFTAGALGTFDGSLSIPVVDPLLLTRTVPLAATVAENTTPPVPRPLAGYSTVVVKPGGTATIRYRVTDAANPTTTVTLQILTSASGARTLVAAQRATTVVKTIKVGTRATNTNLKTSFVCNLKAGVYRYHIIASSPSKLVGRYQNGYLAVGSQPKAYIQGNRSVASGGTLTFRYLLIDPFAKQARMKFVVTLPVKVGSAPNRVVKVFDLGMRPTNIVRTASFRCTLKPGTYRWSLRAVDTVGAIIRSGSNVLIVR